MDNNVCDYKRCTGCGACYHVCPAGCITMSEFTDGNIYPEINREKCIGCRKCEKVCPQLEPVDKHTNIRAYAAWNNDLENYRESASGGTASAICEYAVSRGGMFAGAEADSRGVVKLRLFDKADSVRKVRNSKYVFSTMYDVLGELEEQLKNGREVFFFGLPCQVAAVRKLFGKKYPEQLFLVDLVCHGITPYRYLEQHLNSIEEQCGKTAGRITFREPGGAEKPPVYALSCYDSAGNKFYSKRTADGDAYQYAYHRSVAYRENCYHCLYASPERCGDITLGDFRAYDRVENKGDYPKKVSSVLVNTQRGEAVIKALAEGGSLTIYERPVTEPALYDRQLTRPSPKTKDRLAFEESIAINNGDFCRSIALLCKRNLRKERSNKAKNLGKRAIKKILKR